jgi:hypothetical protein
LTTREYSSPEAFKQALESRLRTSASSVAFPRKRQLLVFDRFLARVVAVLGNTATLKGGLVLEIRLQRARTTKDVDLRMTGSPAEGMRFRAACKLAGRPYGDPFGVDVAYGDPMLGEPEVVKANDLLAFAGIAPPMLRLYPIETHIAEKLHAYTMPRARPNSRVKDLPDLALLATIRPLEAERVRAAVQLTFAFRKTHPPPSSLPEPPTAWEKPYAAMAVEDKLPWHALEEVTRAAKAFLDPVLAGDMKAVWRPQTWTWGAP